MNLFTLVLYCLSALSFICAVAAIISYLRFQEKNQRLPDACEYLDLVQRNKSLSSDNKLLKEEKTELQKIAEEAKEKKIWLEENRPLLLSMEADRKKQEEAKSEYEGYLDKMSNLIPQVQEKRRESEQLSNTIEALNKMRTRINEKLIEAKSLFEQQEDVIREQSTQKAKLDSDVQTLSLTHEKLASEVSTLEEKHSDLLEQMRQLQNEYNTLSVRYQENDVFFSKLNAEIEVAEKNKADLEEKSNKLTEQIDSKKVEKAGLEADNASLMKEIKIRTTEQESFVSKLRELLQQCEEASQKLDEITGEYVTKTEGIEDLNKQLEEMNSKLTVSKNLLEKQEAALQEQVSIKKDIELSIRDLIKNQEELKRIVQSLNESHVALQNRSEKLKNDFDALSQLYRETEISFKKKNIDIAAAEKTKVELEKKEKQLTEKLDSMKVEKAELEARNASLMKENETQSVENEFAVRKLRELQDSVGAEADKLANITAEYTEKKIELDSFQTQKTALLKEIDILKESIEVLRKETGQKITSNEETLKDLWEPIVFPSLPPAKKEKKEQDLLADAKNYIRGKKLYFPERVIHAFHTSMKCNDISPLTVLAGISGTGKSELPKCYAEGMGMHFAMLAVQPRWDSPQDLLGFYNYMENKYKATELARAMVRFDRFNRSNWGELPDGCDDRSDRMLLVLLDEMNLARVEYYFSEFLSKLETRRGVNLEDDKDRVKAEIELELTGRAPLRIFADRNILFTGTMNEDESTQTLSDKVLDRSNVLRFGKPKSANIADKLRNSKPVKPRSEGLSYSCWQKWCIDAKNVKMDEQVTNWINRLNDAMEELQKPFGHRVAQAIATYIANYPEDVTSGDKKKTAFADQIEQRILPKLRGIDLELYEEPLAKIGDLIAETNDETLYSAYEKGRQENSNGIFLWQGVDRSEEA